MWCTTCQQEVPGATHPTTGQTVCSRCQSPKRPPANERPHSAIRDDGIALDEPAAAIAAARSPLSSHTWTHRQRLHSLGRELRRPTFGANSDIGMTAFERQRFDPPQNLFDPPEQVATPTITGVAPPGTVGARRAQRPDQSQLLGWFVILAGMIALAAGTALIARPLYENRMMNWNLALGLAFGGQGALVLGLVLVVSRLWRSSRHAALKLQDASTRLANLQQTADALAAMRTSGAPAFYADLARGASPQVLLANLKGQLDQLASRISGGF